MSKLAKKPLSVPAGVGIKIDNNKCLISGKKSSLELKFNSEIIDVKTDGKEVSVTKKNDSKQAISYSGTIFRTIKTYITGVSTDAGFVFNLDLKGVGYKAVVTENILTLTLGYSHNILVEIPTEVKAVVEKNTRLILSGANKAKVMDFIRFIQKIRKKNVYKGAGIHVEGEFTLTKEVKKAKK